MRFYSQISTKHPSKEILPCRLLHPDDKPTSLQEWLEYVVMNIVTVVYFC